MTAKKQPGMKNPEVKEAPKTEKNPEVKETPKTEKNPEVKEKLPKPKSKRVDKSTYDKYTALKFSSLPKTKLSDEIKKELADLEKEIKACSGIKPVRTVRAAIDNEQALLVEGVPVPEEIEKLIKSKGENSVEYYFG